MKAYIASAWCSKELNIGGNNLTQANYCNISGEVKLIDSLKIYQRSLGELSSTLTIEEKNTVKKLTEKFLNEHYYFCIVWPYLSMKKKEKFLEIILEGKGIIPYEIILDMEPFFIKPENQFWEKTVFFSELKQSAVNDDNYENSKYLYQTLKMRNLGDLNDLYNTQEVILLTEIIESRFEAMKNNYGFNPRKYISASSMSGCIEREIPKIILALPTKYEHVEIFEETVIRGFSCVNTRLAFDSQILLPNLKTKEDLKNNPMNKDFNYKIIYNLKMNNEKVKKRVTTKIFKLDENNQYGNGMTKPLPTGCIKDSNDISWETLNSLLESVSFEDIISHLYIVDIEFDFKNATKREFAYNEIYPPIIEKQRILDACERSVFQLLEQFVMGEKNVSKAYRSAAKAHANLFKKNFLPMYLEDFVFCIKRAGSKVTKIHSHLTFEQKRFKQNFILMNQKSRQESKNSVGKDFYKFMNNSNFGYDCRNNLDNCKFVPIFDEYKELTYIHRFFDHKVSQFVAGDLLRADIEEKFNDKLSKLDKEDRFYETKLQTMKTVRLQQLEATEKFEQQKKKKKEQNWLTLSIEKVKHLPIKKLKV